MIFIYPDIYPEYTDINNNIFRSLLNNYCKDINDKLIKKYIKNVITFNKGKEENNFIDEIYINLELNVNINIIHANIY